MSHNKITRSITIKERKYIVVEGPIGVGKTTLARRIASTIGGTLSLEESAENPFLERFYKAPSRYALQAQLFFLFQRIKQLKEYRQSDLLSPIRVADFMLAKDPLFAYLTLEEDELYLYQQIYRHLAVEVPTPDLVIYLQAPATTLIKRINKRGVLYERNADRRYLEQVVESYARFFLNYHSSPLLVVNAENLNFVENEEHFQLLLQQANQITKGRHYFNPLI